MPSIDAQVSATLLLRAQKLADGFARVDWVRVLGRHARRFDRGVVEFSVADTGTGIEPSARSLIFEPFRQRGSSDSRRHGGVGLGLYVVRRLVDTLGGDLALESTVGCGSTFRVSVPTRQK